MYTISKDVYEAWKDQPILHDEDMWRGKYKTFGEMWDGEAFTIELEDHVAGMIVEPHSIPAREIPEDWDI